MLCLETSQVCTLLFCLHWNVRKILLVSFISLHEGLLLFQVGIISKNCKYTRLALLQRKKGRGHTQKKLTSKHKPTFLNDKVRPDLLALFS